MVYYPITDPSLFTKTKTDKGWAYIGTQKLLDKINEKRLNNPIISYEQIILEPMGKAKLVRKEND